MLDLDDHPRRGAVERHQVVQLVVAQLLQPRRHVGALLHVRGSDDDLGLREVGEDVELVGRGGAPLAAVLVVLLGPANAHDGPRLPHVPRAADDLDVVAHLEPFLELLRRHLDAISEDVALAQELGRGGHEDDGAGARDRLDDADDVLQIRRLAHLDHVSRLELLLWHHVGGEHRLEQLRLGVGVVAQPRLEALELGEGGDDALVPSQVAHGQRLEEQPRLEQVAVVVEARAAACRARRDGGRHEPSWAWPRGTGVPAGEGEGAGERGREGGLRGRLRWAADARWSARPQCACGWG